jgi:hypothetical protein
VDRTPRPSVFKAEGHGSGKRTVPEKRIVVNETEARQATKEGVVRYVLLVSLVLVVVLFAVVYKIFT